MSLQIADVNKLKCKFVSLMKTYIHSITYGISCDKDAVLAEATMVKNYIRIVESGCSSIDTCNIERYIRTSLIEFCNVNDCVTVTVSGCNIRIELIETPKSPCKPMTIQII